MILPEDFLESVKPHVLAADVDLYEAYAVTSTNDWAWEHFEHASERGSLKQSLFIAELQRSGRGTYNRNWHSPVGTGIYSSVLYPVQDDMFNIKSLAQGFVPLYTEIAALAVWITLTAVYPSLMYELRIRGINDLYARHCKLGGILVESRINGAGILRGVVTGVGINLLHDKTLQIIDERNAPISVEELLPEGEAHSILNKKQISYLLAKSIVGLYDMMHEGLLFDYSDHLARIRGPIV